MNECVDSEGNYVRTSEGLSSNTKTGVTAQGGLTSGLEGPSGNTIADLVEYGKCGFSKSERQYHRLGPPSCFWLAKHQTGIKLAQNKNRIEVHRPTAIIPRSVATILFLKIV